MMKEPIELTKEDWMDMSGMRKVDVPPQSHAPPQPPKIGIVFEEHRVLSAEHRSCLLEHRGCLNLSRCTSPKPTPRERVLH